MHVYIHLQICSEIVGLAILSVPLLFMQNIFGLMILSQTEKC